MVCASGSLQPPQHCGQMLGFSMRIDALYASSRRSTSSFRSADPNYRKNKVMSMTNFSNKRKPFRTTTRPRKACKMNVRVKLPTQGLVPRTRGACSVDVTMHVARKRQMRSSKKNYPETACVPSVKRIEYEATRAKRTYLMFLVLTIDCSGCEFVSM